MSLHIADEILAAAVRGEAGALRALVDALQRPFYNLVLRMLGSHDDAEDVTQEALLRVVTHLGGFRGESLFSTWAWTVATRVVLEHRRRRATRRISADDFEADLADARDERARERMEDAVLLQQVKIGCGRAMLACLDDEHRLAYALGEILEVPGPEAAAILGVSHVAFRKRLSRARAEVQRNLSRLCGLVNPETPCRCHRRIAPAQALGRLDERDREGRLHLPELRARLEALSTLEQARAFYHADPTPDAPERLLATVRRALGIGP